MLLWPGQKAKGAAAVGQCAAKAGGATVGSIAAAAGANSNTASSCPNGGLIAVVGGPAEPGSAGEAASTGAPSFVDAEAEGCEDQDEEGDVYFDDEDNEDDDQLFETMDDTPARIQPGLFIGSFLAEQNKEKLRRAGITHVLQVAEGITPSHPQDFTYMGVHVMDSPSEDLVAHFERAFKFIDSAVDQKGACLVHCVAGVSRSSTICIGWLMWKHRIDYDQAFRRVHTVRPWIMPNMGFRHQLRLFQEQDCDLGKWRAWRHQELHGHAYKEEPGAVVSLAGLCIRPPEGQGQGQSNGTSDSSNGDALAGSAKSAAAGAGGGSGQGTGTGTHAAARLGAPSSTYIPELGTSF